MRSSFLACALIAALAGWSQAATVAKPQIIPPGTPIAKKSLPGGLSDATIEQKIRMKLSKSKIGADKFTVKVQGGIAYWEGKTNVIQHKGAATRMAKTAGAVAVVNNIQISDAARQKAARSLTGTLPRATVKRSDTSSPPGR
jgi:osmotically-inducible protein OsmY